MALTITTSAGQSALFDHAALCAFPADCQIEDVSRLFPRRKGRGLKLACLIDSLLPAGEAIEEVTLRSSADDFEKRIAYDLIAGQAVLVYELNGQPLPESAGGPFRLLVPGTTVCGSAELDHCVNVKFLDLIELRLASQTT
ncbi:MAG: molybdopterin-dependent oxidoreductase [Rubinisphaera brasiliensis]|uniref:molybdopterin-dependent oxidoreductase n=1 Tax=Rubinisphaera brasiliensis TaxID=119 RepID=UPI00391CB560|nr:molybdopterin-dependent oxidoreductase [bacterium]